MFYAYYLNILNSLFYIMVFLKNMPVYTIERNIEKIAKY